MRTEILPSEDAQARMAPNSWGAHDTELTELRHSTRISIINITLKEKERTRRGMQRMLFDFCPSRASWLLFFPDDHLAVVRARCEDMAKLWVRPGNLPHGTRVSAMRVDETESGDE